MAPLQYLIALRAGEVLDFDLRGCRTSWETNVEREGERNSGLEEGGVSGES